MYGPLPTPDLAANVSENGVIEVNTADFGTNGNDGRDLGASTEENDTEPFEESGNSEESDNSEESANSDASDDLDERNGTENSEESGKSNDERIEKSKNTTSEDESTENSQDALTEEAKPSLEISLPPELSSKLVDDHYFICELNLLYVLPAKYSIYHLLEDFKDYKTRHSSDVSYVKSVARTVDMFLKYIDILIGHKLLYDYERPQYAELVELNPATQISYTYGPIHLLRLYVKLGEILEDNMPDMDTLTYFMACLENLLKYLETNANQLFSADNYCAAPIDYQRRLFNQGRSASSVWEKFNSGRTSVMHEEGTGYKSA